MSWESFHVLSSLRNIKGSVTPTPFATMFIRRSGPSRLASMPWHGCLPELFVQPESWILRYRLFWSLVPELGCSQTIQACLSEQYINWHRDAATHGQSRNRLEETISRRLMLGIAFQLVPVARRNSAWEKGREDCYSRYNPVDKLNFQIVIP